MTTNVIDAIREKEADAHAEREATTAVIKPKSAKTATSETSCTP